LTACVGGSDYPRHGVSFGGAIINTHPLHSFETQSTPGDLSFPQSGDNDWGKTSGLAAGNPVFAQHCCGDLLLDERVINYSAQLAANPTDWYEPNKPNKPERPKQPSEP